MKPQVLEAMNCRGQRLGVASTGEYRNTTDVARDIQERLRLAALRAKPRNTRIGPLTREAPHGCQQVQQCGGESFAESSSVHRSCFGALGAAVARIRQSPSSWVIEASSAGVNW